MLEEALMYKSVTTEAGDIAYVDEGEGPVALSSTASS